MPNIVVVVVVVVIIIIIIIIKGSIPVGFERMFNHLTPFRPVYRFVLSVCVCVCVCRSLLHHFPTLTDSDCPSSLGLPLLFDAICHLKFYTYDRRALSDM